jgi:hypothetical protein
VDDRGLTKPLYIAEAFNKYFLSVAENNNSKSHEYSEKYVIKKTIFSNFQWLT